MSKAFYRCATATIAATLASVAMAQNFARETEWMEPKPWHDECCTDMGFAKKAYMMNMAMVQLGKLASTQGSSPEVRTFGEHIAEGHEAANRQLALVNDSWDRDMWPTRLDDESQAAYDRLARMSGTDFDHNFMLTMEYGHRDAWKKYTTCGANVYDSDLKAYVAQTKDDIEHHVKMLEAKGYGSYTLLNYDWWH